MAREDEDASNSPDTPSASNKRKADDSAQPQTRAKRNRYISIACNECKRRKIKCNGETPCQRCGRLSLECLYAPNCCNNFKDTDDFKQMNSQLLNLQEQVDLLYQNLSSLHSQIDPGGAIPLEPFPGGGKQYVRSSGSAPAHTPGLPPISPVRSRSQMARLPRFHGPTSATFNIGVAKSSLQTMGITSQDDGLDDALATLNGTPAASPPHMMHQQGVLQKVLHHSKDPVWGVEKEEAIRLCRVWHEEMGIMYPFMDIEQVVQHARLLYTFIEAANRSGVVQLAAPGADAIHDDQTNLLKVILSIALVLEGTGRSELGKKMFENISPVVDAQLMGPVDMKGIQMLALAAMYHFHRDDEGLAWRVVGLAARLCMELGLHRRETYETLFKTPEEKDEGVRLFWSIYVLDRRWSFGTGMPFALQDADIDPLLPRPDDSTPYLTAMVTYSQIGSKVWKSVANVDSTSNVNKEDIGYLDYQILEWLRSIPPSLKFTHPRSNATPEACSRGTHRLKVALYLRANQMRILIYRPVLHTATSIMENIDSANRVVAIAKDTIDVLAHTNQTSDLYRTQQMMFNYFLISALAVLFLAVSHAPARYSDYCRQEFYAALDLVRGLSANSHVSKRLWKTIKVLKEVAPKLGLNVRNPEADAHSSAAVAMAGLAGHQVNELALFSNGVGQGPMSYSPNGMANDLTNLFEAAGQYGNGVMNNRGAYVLGRPEEDGGFGQEDELARIMRDLF
ncbi:fungal-specific transcription factor-like protein [Pseudovirgaria hyperparasitica]|uniref:Fungal-specific transcription factor-like protein n=1 Tax=Pseudovirgaria hyperparasitica TaxID=470096 RepID=A0A6A6WGB0_9PEZI|nr:fungal-specific transcription factor-like protein [Pseudovirgaria hyperparasitica]KAF2761813.1 fungal-specific transcription factor-like protein [Pseudovirgaria hyperparasitica]